ncbi:preprotein translocase subunit SecB [Glaciecola punicea ACAM 611]|jgi:preprotein translocase subunit SecB|uniref:Protein-export protein SecB n=1 Tax=Glaciecola punicea ACAM 611 TaxID=1121923 RepID=H5TEY1_9ALTE|nr:protein-export chaperone SecB [Glaciecola punicea]OFA32704.1 protein-export chaperone SecB [Glaciecola punicea]GAB56908.1 preprotein translocase subunit SecB [Glaciecola punicea ACAM 611]
MADEPQPQDEPQDAQQQQEVQFNVQRIYTKDISFETPNSPSAFQKEWKPEIKLDIDTRTQELSANLFEVTLSVTVTATNDGDTAFLCEVQQAGIFAIGEMPANNKAHMLGSYCPNLLFPYARETVSNLVNRGTFPVLNLAPVNFDAIFTQYVQKRQEEAAKQALESDDNAPPKLDS